MFEKEIEELKRISNRLLAIVMIAGAVSCSGKYETFKGDPMNTKIYTLKNGLKVYMTVNKEEPRLQTLIAVRNGGKNDPADNTGLAHYLEHIMFKGSESFGTSDYAAEKPLLDQIERLYNVYRTKTDPEERKAFIAEKEAEYKDLFASPYQAANRGYIDDVIEPRYTRSRIIRAFEMLQTKRLTNPLKKHSNIPL